MTKKPLSLLFFFGPTLLHVHAASRLVKNHYPKEITFGKVSKTDVIDKRTTVKTKAETSPVI